MAREGARGRSIARRSAQDDAATRTVLGDAVRLAQMRGEAERAAELHHRDRWPGYSFHPRSVQARRCIAADRDAWMARFGPRADEDRRSADQSDRAWWKRIRRLPPRHSIDARLRVFGQADRARLGARAHRARL